MKRTPKPTWSLKELSDDEGARDGYGSDSSDYEPTSSSDSDSDREKSSSSTSKRARLAHSGQPGQRSNGSLSSHRMSNSMQSSGNGKGKPLLKICTPNSKSGCNFTASLQGRVLQT